ncbi:MAG: hypothetical protein V1662_05650 [Candidatus Omnitrophota bacterium]
MKKTRGKNIIAWGAGVFFFGLLSGILWNVCCLEASSPKGEASKGEDRPSTFWDEHWQAARAYVSSSSGYQEVTIDINSNNPLSVVSGKMSKNSTEPARVVVYPDMVVNRWKVHGHIHFR